MNKFYDKFLPGGSAVKHDWWSETVGKGLAQVGITTDVRNSLQGTVDQAVGLLPKGGAVPAPSTQIGSIPQATGYSYQGNISPTMIIAVIAGALVLAYLVKKG